MSSCAISVYVFMSLSPYSKLESRTPSSNWLKWKGTISASYPLSFWMLGCCGQPPAKSHSYSSTCASGVGWGGGGVGWGGIFTCAPEWGRSVTRAQNNDVQSITMICTHIHQHAHLAWGGVGWGGAGCYRPFTCGPEWSVLLHVLAQSKNPLHKRVKNPVQKRGKNQVHKRVLAPVHIYIYNYNIYIYIFVWHCVLSIWQ